MAKKKFNAAAINRVGEQIDEVVNGKEMAPVVEMSAVPTAETNAPANTAAETTGGASAEVPAQAPASDATTPSAPETDAAAAETNKAEAEPQAAPMAKEESQAAAASAPESAPVAAKPAVSLMEKERIVNIRLPESYHRRMMVYKYSVSGETLNTIAVKAIGEFLDAKGV